MSMSTTILCAPAAEPADTVPSTKLDDVFEGPEKKLEVFFSRPASPSGFRCFDETVWSDVLTEARCTILHCQPSAHFDAYLLSESSLFVYPTRLILKTCGTTTLILVLPKLLALAARLGAALEHVHYSHLRYKFPSLQVYPHTCFRTEQRCLADLLGGHIGAVHARVIGAQTGMAWYALCTEPAAEAAEALLLSPDAEAEDAALEPPLKKRPRVPPSATPLAAPAAADDDADHLEHIFEVAMEGLPASVCNVFYEDYAAHGGRSGRELATSMTELTGIDALLPADTIIDDWAFEPCGYSMNAAHRQHYYTIHITPELAFSYASFETNDPAYRQPEKIAAIVRAFAPSSLTVTLTSRSRTGGAAGGAAGAAPALPVFSLDGLECTSHEQHDLTAAVSVCCATFGKSSRTSPAEIAAGAGVGTCELSAAAEASTLPAKVAVRAGEEGEEDVGVSEGSEASTDDTFPVSEVGELIE